MSNNEAKLDDFILDRTIGMGSFSVVKIAYLKKNPSKKFAIKILKKEHIIKMKQVEHTLNEKKILSSISCPFIVNLAYSFKDNSNLYMVLEYVNGGEMYTHLRGVGCYNENASRFYASQVVLAFEYLHFLNIIYRDLKPENILIDSTGYLKLTDFGFAKVVKDITWTLCGTPEYISPEILSSRGYNKAADYWALGVLVYEMCAGYSPFGAETQIKTYEKILSGDLRLPAQFSIEVKNLITNLLQSDLTKRLGNLKNGINDIKQHKWFNSIDWISIFEKRVKPPYVPREEFETYDEEPVINAANDQFVEEFLAF